MTVLLAVASCNKPGNELARLRALSVPPPGCSFSGGDAYLPVITQGEDQYACVDWTATNLEGPLQNPTTQTVLVPTSSCAAGKISVTTGLYKNAGSLNDKAGGDYKSHAAFVVGTITNNSNCDWAGNKVTLAKNTSYYIVIYGKGNGAYLVPPAGGPEKLKFASCADLGMGGDTAAGDYAYLKDDADKCDHKGPGIAGTQSGDSAGKGGRPFDIGPTGLVWLACSTDCCYAQQ